MKRVMLVLFLLVGGVVNSQTTKKSSYTLTYEQADELKEMYKITYNYTEIENEFLDVINRYRVENNLTALVRDTSLDNFVLKQNTYNKEHRLNGHDSDITAEERFKSFKKYRIYGENAIRSGYSACFSENGKCSIAENVFNGWKRSPGHNKIMLSKGTYKIGISIMENTNHEIFAVMVLAF